MAGAEGKTHPVSKRICGGLSFARKRVFKLFFPSLAVFLFNPIYLLFQLFVYETCRGLYLIKHRYGSFFFTRVQVGIGVPRHFDFGVSQPSRHLLNVDSHVGEQGGVGMPLRYNKDKRKNPVFSRVSAFVVAYSIPFPTLIVNEKSVE